MPAETIENRLFADIQIGDTAQLTRIVTAEDIDHYAAASGDFNPSHVDQAYAEERQMGRRVAHSLWGASLFSSLLGNVLPGPGTVYRSQILDFHRPLYLGDSLTVIVTAVEKRPDLKSVLFDYRISNQDGEVAITGTAEVIAPTVKIRRPRVDLPGFSRVHPDLPQVVCFNTAFHHTIPRLAQLYALPRALTEAGLYGYGFHGLSYEYIVSELRRIDPGAAVGRTVVAHLGSGASLCALVSGQSVACTLGFGALDGLVMGTRPGRLDPGILLYLLQARGMDAKALEQLLYQESGLLGVSGISNDMRDLQASDSPHAREAIDLFIYRAARELGSMVAAAGGLDALVFTAGIGEHDPEVRAGICAQSAWLGIELDPVANRTGNPCISTPDSAVTVRVIPTNEEQMIALHTLHTLGKLQTGV